MFMIKRMDGALTKWAVGIFTEGKGEGPVTNTLLRKFDVLTVP